MANDYLIGFQRGFQPDQKTALTAYHAILKRKPDFLAKQIPTTLTVKQKQALGESEGKFLTPEIKVTAEKVEFSQLAQKLLFGNDQQHGAESVTKKAVEKQVPAADKAPMEPIPADQATTQEPNEPAPTADNQWQF